LVVTSISSAQTRQGLIRLTRIGPLVEVENNVTGGRIEGTPNERITEDNTVITTGEGSRVILVFSNGATINLSADSQLNIETFQQDPFGGDYSIETATQEPEAKSITRLSLTRGELVGNVKTLRSDLGSEFTVSTPAGAAGIRGTTFRIVYRPDGNGQAFFSVMTLEGDVAVTTGTTGTTAAPISVTNEQTIEITVEVNDTTGEVTVVTPVASLVPTTATPQEVAQATESFQQSAEAVVAIVLTAANDQVTGGTGNSGGTNTGTNTPAPEAEKKETAEPKKGNSETTNPTNTKNETTPQAGSGG
jgi:hypothetical protein